MGNLTCTASGSVANFYTPYAVPIRSFKVHFSPKQSGSGDPSPENVRPIEGWTGVTGYRCGKNLFDEASVTFGMWTYSSGDVSTTAQYGCITDKIPVNSDSKFAIARFGVDPYSYSLIEYDSQGNFIARNHSGVVTSTFVVSTLNANTKYIALQVATNTNRILTQEMLSSYKMMLVFGTEMSSVYEPYHCNEIPVSFGDLGTIYGGYVDLVTGDVVEEWYGFKGCWKQYNSSNGYIAYRKRDLPKPVKGYNLSNAIDTFGTFSSSNMTMNKIQPPDDNISTVAYLSLDENYSADDVSYYYKLATPITHTLSPQTLSTLVHSNAFWSNADSVEIEYDLAECGDIREIRRRILLNTPHVESASGSVAHFSTDMASKLKECRVNFLPQQAGSGDPSPSNVRAISGWMGCDVVRSGKNIVQVLGYSAKNVNSKTATRHLTNSYGTTISTTDFSLPDSSVAITQSQWENSDYLPSSANGYVVIAVDNIEFGQSYNVSLRVTNITNNPLNINISNLILIVPSGTSSVGTMVDDRLCFNNITFNQSTANPNRSSFEIRICGMSFTLSEFMVTPVEDEDYTWEPYNGNQITVSWANLGTIYGGFIDVLRGELVQEWEMVDFGDLNWTKMNNYDVFSANAGDIEVVRSNIVISEIYKPYSAGSSIVNMPDKSIKNHDTNTYLYCKDTDYTTASDFIAATTGKKIVYKLATPITYPLSPEIIKALKGVNNVFSDAGDVSVRFWRH